jgi:drug/metabolite transporter (DMT)-like permease
MNPNVIAFVASLMFAIVAFPWSSTLRKVGPGGFFLFLGAVFAVTGAVKLMTSGPQVKLTAGAVGLAVLTSVLYVGALLCMNYIFGHPQANIPVATAITGSYPAWITIIAFARGQRFTWQELFFLTVVLVGVVGLALNSKPAQTT